MYEVAQKLQKKVRLENFCVKKNIECFFNLIFVKLGRRNHRKMIQTAQKFIFSELEKNVKFADKSNFF